MNAALNVDESSGYLLALSNPVFVAVNLLKPTRILICRVYQKRPHMCV